MASGGTEESNQASSVPLGLDPPCSPDRKPPMSTVAPPGARVVEDQPLCVSGNPPPLSAYLCVPTASPAVPRAGGGRGGVWNACASCANAAADGGSACAVVPKTPRPCSVPPVSTPAPLEPGTPWPSDPHPLRLRSGLLGKRALSPQPCPYPPCPSPPKALSASAMPTNQSSPWGSPCQLRGSGEMARLRATPGPLSAESALERARESAGQDSAVDSEPTGQALIPDQQEGESGVVLDTDTLTACGTGEEPCCVPMDTSSTPCFDDRICVCNVTCPAIFSGEGPGAHSQINGTAPEHPSVYSVTSQISSIHLTKQSHPSTPELSPQVQSAVSQGTPQECGEEEELADKLENQGSGDDDDGSEASALSDASAATLVLANVDELMTPELEDSRTEKPALVPSLFPFTPPTLYFSTANERVEPLPPEQSKLLKWKMSSVTPNVVKHTLARSHFRATKKSHDWLGCWGHHMRSPGFRAIHEHQKLNHFPGSFQIGRKDRLWRNLSKMQALYGKREFSFFPQSFVLPQDMKLLRRAWEEGGSRIKWIIKPPASARGNGIQVIHRWSQMPRRRPLLVQRYLHKPYLISGSKFDLRIYVYVSSYNPLRIYVFSDGLVRFASCKYSSSMKSLSNKFMHLTNYSVNKKNSEYQSNSDDQTCQGHKWALKALWQYLGRKGMNTTLIWEKIKDIVIKTIIAADPYVNTLVQTNVRSAYSCHELFGFDIMLDENLKPWLLEVNISPSLHSSSALDVSVKGPMVRDVLNLAGFVLPQEQVVAAAETSDDASSSSSRSSVCEEVKESAGVTPELSADEKAKRMYYQSLRFPDQELLSSTLDVLTAADVRALVETEDELSRRGQFERVFPSPTSARYLRFFQQPRYLNILLSQWERRHWGDRSQGVSLLRSLCLKGVHLGSSSDPAHTWSPKPSPGQKLELHTTLSPTQEPPTSGSRDQHSCTDLLSGATSLSDIHLQEEPISPGSPCRGLHPKDCA
ncbi:hypothetical protein AGOR_G00058080 [Albula goreensis]|uniref:Tubulin polyglutamylase TTLL4 n=1 Tax=Albula goreensis TaxID=1534307 RepID=A0A8T3DUM3_9TELE|nr:hypothetical protein AGOR_G00058080 [Albula goreensis]